MSHLESNAGYAGNGAAAALVRPVVGHDPTAAGRADGAEERTLVTFRLAWQTYALPLECVERVLRMVAITKIPEAPADVLGVIDLQGEVIPVVDLRHRLGLARKTVHVDDRLLVVRVAHLAMAFAIDEASSVLTVAASLVESPPQSVAGGRPVAAVIRTADGLLLVLDEERLLSSVGAWQESSRLDENTQSEPPVGEDANGLTRVRGIGRVYAVRLAQSGLQTLEELACADADEVVNRLGLPQARRAEAQRWIERAAELARHDDRAATGDVATEPVGRGD